MDSHHYHLQCEVGQTRPKQVQKRTLRTLQSGPLTGTEAHAQKKLELVARSPGMNLLKTWNLFAHGIEKIVNLELAYSIVR